MPLFWTTLDSFCRAPIGRYVALPTVTLWASSPSLCSGIAWDVPSEEDARNVIRTFDHYGLMDNPFSIVIDARHMTGFAPGALPILFGWLAANHAGLAARLRLQVNLIERGPIGFIAAGMLNSIRGSHPMQVFTDSEEAFCAAGGDAAAPLVSELDELVSRLRGVPPEIVALRARLVSDLDSSLERVASDIGISTRSLQRLLSKYGSSFKDEVTAARLALAQRLLVSTDDKLALIAARVGTSERALTSLFRAHTSLAPAEWRRLRMQVRNAGNK